MEGSGNSKTVASNGTVAKHCNAPNPTEPVTVPVKSVNNIPAAESPAASNGLASKSQE